MKNIAKVSAPASSPGGSTAPVAPAVLVVDDNAITLKLARLALEAAGYPVLTADTGHAALDLCRAHRPALILLDLGLPDLPGKDLARRLHQLPGCAELPIIAVTGMAVAKDGGIPEGFTDILAKPVEPSRLVQVVAEFLDDGHSGAAAPAGKCVLLVDDDPIQLKSLRLHLEHAGYAVLTAGDAEEAFALALQRQPDVVLSDVLMPGVDGFRLCRRLRSHPALARLRVLLASAHYIEDADRQLALRAGASAYLCRSAGTDALLQALRDTLAQPPPAVGVATLFSLSTEHYQRVSSQLERQVALQHTQEEREHERGALLDHLAAIGEALVPYGDPESTLEAVLPSCLNSVGLSGALLYTVDAQGTLELRCQVGCDAILQSAKTLFGSIDYFSQGLLERGVKTLSATTAPPELVRGMLSPSGARSALFLPLAARSQAIGVLLLLSRNHDLYEDTWIGFGRVLAAQITQVLLFDRAQKQLIRCDAGEAAHEPAADAPAPPERTDATLRHLAYFDPWTGLHSRNAFLLRLAQAAHTAQRKGHGLGVLLLGIANLREINDTLGHTNGDTVLHEVGRRLHSLVAEPDMVARLGTAQIGVLLSHPAGPDEVGDVAQRLLDALQPPCLVTQVPVAVQAYVGAAVLPTDATRPQELLRRASVALHAAQEQRTPYLRYSRELDRFSPQRLALICELKQALTRNELELWYQPKIDLAQQQITSVEALLRWRHPQRGLILPGEFIPAAEKTGLVDPLTMWVAETALDQLRFWHREGLPLKGSINISPQNLRAPEFPGQLLHALHACDLPAGTLTLELTENAVMEDPKRAIRALEELHRHGVLLALDDFGIGQSSLALLQQLPVDELKLDKFFAASMPSDSSMTIARTTVRLAHELHLEITAEGVETEDALQTVRQMGYDRAQGFHIARPMPAAELEAWLGRRTAASAQPASGRVVVTDTAVSTQ